MKNIIALNFILEARKNCFPVLKRFPYLVKEFDKYIGHYNCKHFFKTVNFLYGKWLALNDRWEENVSGYDKGGGIVNSNSLHMTKQYQKRKRII